MRSKGPAKSDSIYQRLLVVDDELLNQRLAERVLVKLHYYVDIVGDGEEALAAARERGSLLILMDCQVPIMDGVEAARAMRLVPGQRGQTSIIAMTAFDRNENRQCSLGAGMNAFSPKQVDWSSVETFLQNTMTNGFAAVEVQDRSLSTKPDWREHVALDLNALAQAIGDGNGPDVVAKLVWLFRTEGNVLFDRTSDRDRTWFPQRGFGRWAWPTLGS